ncbi:MAG: folate family ECF transporter S component [Lachnospiraceae bacterium]
MQTKLTAKTISAAGILIAAEIVLSRFLSIQTWNLRIGFSFIPIVIAAILFGPITAGLIAVLSDLIGYFLVPSGTFFPGFTVTACITGVVFALFLYKKQSLPRIIAAVLSTQILLSLGINTLWLSILYGTAYKVLFLTRIYQVVAMSIVQIVLILIISKKIIPVLKRIM